MEQVTISRGRPTIAELGKIKETSIMILKEYFELCNSLCDNTVFFRNLLTPLCPVSPFVSPGSSQRQAESGLVFQDKGLT